jgi:hypothetical protein
MTFNGLIGIVAGGVLVGLQKLVKLIKPQGT